MAVADQSPNRVTGKFTIEFGGANNAGSYFEYTGESYRGRWQAKEFKDGGPFGNLEDHDGIKAELDIGARTLRIWDPLKTDMKMQAHIKDIWKKAQVLTEPVWTFEERLREDLDEDDIKTCMTHFRLQVDCKQAWARGRDLPTKEEIEAMPGRRIINEHDPDPRAPRREGDPDMRDLSQSLPIVLGDFMSEIKGMFAATLAATLEATRQAVAPKGKSSK